MEFLDWYLLGTAFVLGAVVGSFLNVLIYRMHTGKSLGGSSHCLSCENNLRWFELLPLISYLTLRGRCRYCGSLIPSRYFWVELLTGLSFLGVWYLFATDLVLLLAHAFLVSVLITILVYDLRHTIIPDELTALSLGVAVALVIYGNWLDISAIALHVLGGIIAASFFAALWYFSGGRWVGLGDAKLALPFGTLVGLNGIFSFIVLSFWVGAGISLFIIGYQHLVKRGKRYLPFMQEPLTMKSEVPFAPFLIAGFGIVYFCHLDVFSLTYSLLSWF